MKRKLMYILTLIVVVFMFGSLICFAGTDSTATDKEINPIISTDSAATVIRGYCNGDGVKFKVAPNASSATLVLCYKQEILYKYPSPAGTPSSWIYVYRPKTNQYGYIASQYFSSNTATAI